MPPEKVVALNGKEGIIVRVQAPQARREGPRNQVTIDTKHIRVWVDWLDDKPNTLEHLSQLTVID